MRKFFNRIAILTALGVMSAGCANTSSTSTTGGGATTDTSTSGGGGTDTTSGGTGGGGDTSTGGGGGDTSSAGAEKSIVDIQKASVACTADAGGKEPQTFGEAKGITIRNAVVVSPGRKEGSNGTLVGMFVQQQGGGQFSGIYVTGSNTGELGTAKVGDVITITGDVKDYYCFTEVFAKYVTVESQGAGMPAPLTVTTDDLGDIAGKDKTEPYEGVLVQLHDVVVGDDALGSDGKPHGSIYIGKTADDKALRMGSAFFGVYLSNYDKETKTYTPKYPKGTKLGTVTGVIDYSFGTYQLTITQDPENVVAP